MLLRNEQRVETFANGPALLDHLPYAEVIGDIVLGVDGSLGRIWGISGFESELASQEALRTFSDALAGVISRVPPQMDVQIMACSRAGGAEAAERYQRQTRTGATPVEQAICESKIAGLQRQAPAGTVLTVRQIRLYLSVRGYFPAWPDAVEKPEQSWKKISGRFRRMTDPLESGLRSLGLGCEPLDEKALRQWLYAELNPVRSQTVPLTPCREGLLRDRVLYHEPRVIKGDLILEQQHIRISTVRDLPAETHPGMMVRPSPGGSCLWDAAPELKVVFNICVPDQSHTLDQVKQQKMFAFLQRGTTTGNVSEEAVGKQEELSDVIRRMYRDGHVLSSARIHLVSQSLSEESAEAAGQALGHVCGRSGLQLVHENVIGASLFLTCLPLNFESCFETFIRRSRRLLSNNLADLLPVYSMFQGTRTPAAVYLNRIGEPVFLDLFDLPTNPHAVIIGASGAGKSFFTNDLVYQNFRTGAHFFVLDKGNSYRKTCGLLGGEYISFEMEDPVCLNPFACVPDAEGLAFLVDMLSLMASGGDDRDRLSREEKGLLHLAVVEAFSCHKQSGSSRELTLSDVVAVLEHAPEAMVRGVDPDLAPRIALRLVPFTRRGPYGKFFDGPRTIGTATRFTVFELAQISRYPELQLVVLLNIMYLVTEFVSGPSLRGERKFLIVDEAWQLLKTEATAGFITTAFKTFRKYRCSVMAVTQEAADLLQQPAGLAILANSAGKIFLRQDPGIIERMVKELALTPRTGEILRSLCTVKGRYSEALALVPGAGSGQGGGEGGVIRLAADPFLYWAATSDAEENAWLERTMNERGCDMAGAILAGAREKPHGLR